jgi:uncharacterized SAM-binding protein YcdF (DUF218 family)
VTGLDATPLERVARPSPRRRYRLWGALMAGIVILILLIVTLRQPLLAGLGESLVVSDPLEHADLIYVLGGDFWGSRVLLGARLGSQGWAPKVLLAGSQYSGAGDPNSYASDLAVDFAVKHGYSRSLFVPVRIEARSTIDEALVVRPLFHRLGAKRIMLVTSNFHSRRALQVFRLFLPEFDFRVEGSVDDSFDPEAWWKKPEERHLLFSEYEKMMGTPLVRAGLIPR